MVEPIKVFSAVHSVYQPLFSALTEKGESAAAGFVFVEESDLVRRLRRNELVVAFVSIPVLAYISGYRWSTRLAWFQTSGGPYIVTRDSQEETGSSIPKIGFRDRWMTGYLVYRLMNAGFWPLFEPSLDLIPHLRQGDLDGAVMDNLDADTLEQQGCHVRENLRDAWTRRFGQPQPMAIGVIRTDRIDEGLRLLEDLAEHLSRLVERHSRDELVELVTTTRPELSPDEIRYYLETVDGQRWTSMGDETQSAVDGMLEEAARRAVLPSVRVHGWSE